MTFCFCPAGFFLVIWKILGTMQRIVSSGAFLGTMHPPAETTLTYGRVAQLVEQRTDQAQHVPLVTNRIAVARRAPCSTHGGENPDKDFPQRITLPLEQH